MSIEDHGKQALYHRFFACRICGRKMYLPIAGAPILIINGLVFCSEHAREFRRRRREGVRTAELEAAWGDTLRIWRERPPELDKETHPKFMATFFTFLGKEDSWLVFERSYYHFSLPHWSTPSRTIRNPAKDPWARFRRYRSSPPLHRLSDYLVINLQMSEIRRFVDVTVAEVLYDLRGICPAPAQSELARFWGQRKASGIREKTREHLRWQAKDPEK